MEKQNQKGFSPIFITMIVAVLVLGATGLVVYLQTAEPGGDQSQEPIACAQDAKQCPDGSYVGRVVPTCNFAPCPSAADETPKITIISPNGGETFECGDPINISWASEDAKYIVLDMQDENDFSYGVGKLSELPNNGFYDFTSTYNLPSGDYKIKAYICPEDIGDLGTCWREDLNSLKEYGFDESDDYFHFEGCPGSERYKPQ